MDAPDDLNAAVQDSILFYTLYTLFNIYKAILFCTAFIYRCFLFIKICGHAPLPPKLFYIGFIRSLIHFLRHRHLSYPAPWSQKYRKQGRPMVLDWTAGASGYVRHSSLILFYFSCVKKSSKKYINYLPIYANHCTCTESLPTYAHAPYSTPLEAVSILLNVICDKQDVYCTRYFAHACLNRSNSASAAFRNFPHWFYQI